jgi:hypothetical protein
MTPFPEQADWEMGRGELQSTRSLPPPDRRPFWFTTFLLSAMLLLGLLASAPLCLAV